MFSLAYKVHPFICAWLRVRDVFSSAMIEPPCLHHLDFGMESLRGATAKRAVCSFCSCGRTAIMLLLEPGLRGF